MWDDLWSGFTHDGSFIAPEPAEPADIETLFGRGDLAREQSPIENAGSAVIRADNARAVGRAMEAVLAQPFTCRDGAGGGHAA